MPRKEEQLAARRQCQSLEYFISNRFFFSFYAGGSNEKAFRIPIYWQWCEQIKHSPFSLSVFTDNSQSCLWSQFRERQTSGFSDSYTVSSASARTPKLQMQEPEVPWSTDLCIVPGCIFLWWAPLTVKRGFFVYGGELHLFADIRIKIFSIVKKWCWPGKEVTVDYLLRPMTSLAPGT